MKTNYIKCGDCFKLLKTLNNKSVDVVFTSPPYNRKRNDVYDLFDDVTDDYFELLNRLTAECLRVAKDKVIINVQQNYYNKKDFFKYLGEYADNISGVVVWCKTNPKPVANYNSKTNTKSVTNAFEYFVFLTNNGVEFKAYGKEATYNYITSSINVKSSNNHKAIMKQEISDWFIEKFTKENDIVLDPFCGLGTTAISCKKMNRRFIGFEIVKEYCKEAIKRIKEN